MRKLMSKPPPISLRLTNLPPAAQGRGRSAARSAPGFRLKSTDSKWDFTEKVAQWQATQDGLIRSDGPSEGRCRGRNRKEKPRRSQFSARRRGRNREEAGGRGVTIITSPFTFYDIDAFFRVQRFF